MNIQPNSKQNMMQCAAANPQTMKGVVALQAMVRGAQLRTRMRTGQYPGVPLRRIEEVQSWLRDKSGHSRPTHPNSIFCWSPQVTSIPPVAPSALTVAKASTSTAPQLNDLEAEARKRAAERVQQQMQMSEAQEAEARRRAAERVQEQLGTATSMRRDSSLPKSARQYDWFKSPAPVQQNYGGEWFGELPPGQPPKPSRPSTRSASLGHREQAKSARATSAPPRPPQSQRSANPVPPPPWNFPGGPWPTPPPGNWPPAMSSPPPHLSQPPHLNHSLQLTQPVYLTQPPYPPPMPGPGPMGQPSANGQSMGSSAFLATGSMVSTMTYQQPPASRLMPRAADPSVHPAALGQAPMRYPSAPGPVSTFYPPRPSHAVPGYMPQGPPAGPFNMPPAGLSFESMPWQQGPPAGYLTSRSNATLPPPNAPMQMENTSQSSSNFPQSSRSLVVAPGPAQVPWQTFDVQRRQAELEADRQAAIQASQDMNTRRIVHQRLQELEAQVAEKEAELQKQEEALWQRECQLREAESQVALSRIVEAPDIIEEREAYYRKVRLGTVTLADKQRMQELEEREKYARIVHREQEADRVRLEYERTAALKRTERRAEIEKEKELLREKQRLAMEEREHLRRQEELAMVMEMNHAEWKMQWQRQMAIRLQCMYRSYVARQAARGARLQWNIRNRAATQIQAAWRGAVARVYITASRPTLELRRHALWSRIERLDLCEEEERMRAAHEFVYSTILDEIGDLFRRELEGVLHVAKLNWLVRAEAVDRRALMGAEAGDRKSCLQSEQQQRSLVVWAFMQRGQQAEQEKLQALEAFSRSDVLERELNARKDAFTRFVQSRIQIQMRDERRQHSHQWLQQFMELERHESAMWAEGLSGIVHEMNKSLIAAVQTVRQRISKEMDILQYKEVTARGAIHDTENATWNWLMQNAQTDYAASLERQQFIGIREQQILQGRGPAAIRIQKVWRGFQGRKYAQRVLTGQRLVRYESLMRNAILDEEMLAKAAITGIVLLAEDMEQEQQDVRCQIYVEEAQARELIVGLEKKGQLSAGAARRRKDAQNMAVKLSRNADFTQSVAETQRRKERQRAQEREEEERRIGALLRQREQNLQAKSWTTELPPVSPHPAILPSPALRTFVPSQLGASYSGPAADWVGTASNEPFAQSLGSSWESPVSSQRTLGPIQKGRYRHDLHSKDRRHLPGKSTSHMAWLENDQPAATPSASLLSADELRRQRQRLLADLDILSRDTPGRHTLQPLPPLR